MTADGEPRVHRHVGRGRGGRGDEKGFRRPDGVQDIAGLGDARGQRRADVIVSPHADDHLGGHPQGARHLRPHRAGPRAARGDPRKDGRRDLGSLEGRRRPPVQADIIRAAA